MKPINIVIIGVGMYVCGRGTETYGTVIPAILEWNKTRSLGDVYIVGTTSESANIARYKIEKLKRKMCANANFKYFPETGKKDPRCYKKAIRKISKPACAIIAVPDALHCEIAGTAIEHGLHVMVVKPLAPTLREVGRLISLQREKQVYCAVEFHKRLDYANLKLKDAIAEDKIGDPLYFLVEYSQRKSMPTKIFKKWVKSTNVFQYLGIHYVDIIYFTTGAIPKRVAAIGQKNWLRSEGIDTYDSIEGIIEWEMPSGRKSISCILTSWVDPESTSAMSDQKIKVVGTKGRFESDQKRRGITIVTDDGGIEEPNPYFCAAYGSNGDVEYRGYGIESICQFLRDADQVEKGLVRIEDLEGVRPTFKGSVVPTAVLEGINKSLKMNGRWVKVRIPEAL